MGSLKRASVNSHAFCTLPDHILIVDGTRLSEGVDDVFESTLAEMAEEHFHLAVGLQAFADPHPRVAVLRCGY